MRIMFKNQYSIWDVTAIGVGAFEIAEHPDMVAYIMFAVFLSMLFAAWMKDMLGD